MYFLCLLLKECQPLPVGALRSHLHPFFGAYGCLLIPGFFSSIPRCAHSQPGPNTDVSKSTARGNRTRLYGSCPRPFPRTATTTTHD